ncbi:MAG: hypothetical protein RL368_1765 [Pseudomonadota bacterium]|jgi:hypothetical protein
MNTNTKETKHNEIEKNMVTHTPCSPQGNSEPKTNAEGSNLPPSIIKGLENIPEINKSSSTDLDIRQGVDGIILHENPAIDRLLKFTLAKFAKMKCKMFCECQLDKGSFDRYPCISYGLSYGEYISYVQALCSEFPKYGMTVILQKCDMTVYLKWLQKMQLPDYLCYFMEHNNYLQTEYFDACEEPAEIEQVWLSFANQVTNRGVDPKIYGYRLESFTIDDLTNIKIELERILSLEDIEADFLYFNNVNASFISWNGDRPGYMPFTVKGKEGNLRALFASFDDIEQTIKDELKRRVKEKAADFIPKPKVN